MYNNYVFQADEDEDSIKENLNIDNTKNEYQVSVSTHFILKKFFF